MKTIPLTPAIFLIAILLTTSLSAQVTIGSGQPPAAGALLDLKQDGTTTGGLGMPRVALINLTPTTPAELSASIGNTGNWNLTEHIGLIVYNTKEDLCVATPIYKGLYVFDGTQWQSLGADGGTYKITDPRDGEIYLARNFGAIAGDWMLENIRYAPKVADGYTGYTHTAEGALVYVEKYYAYPEGDGVYIPANHPSSAWESKKKNGLLYNWMAATNGQNTNNENQGQGENEEGPLTPVQGICPANWHVPSDRELNDLERELYTNAHKYSTYTEAEKNAWNTLTPWSSPWETEVSFRPAGNPSDAHDKVMMSPCPPVGSAIVKKGKSLTAQQGGFNLLPVGSGGGGSTYYGAHSFLWSSSSFAEPMDPGSFYAWGRFVIPPNSGVNRAPDFIEALYSVRCKKD